jgi:TonB family protein
MRRTLVALAAVAALGLMPGCRSTPGAAPAAAQAALPPACTMPPAAESLGEHDVHLAAWLVRKDVAVRAEGSSRALVERVLADVGGRVPPPAKITVAFDPLTAFVGASDTLTPQRMLADLKRSMQTGGRTPEERTSRARSDSVQQAGSVTPLVVRGQLRFTLHADGHVSRFRHPRRSPVVQLDSAVEAAVRESGESGVLRGLVSGGEAGVDSVELAMNLLTRPTRADSVGAIAPLARVRLPHYRLFPASLVMTGVAPRYPDAARAEGREGQVVVKYVVLPDGSVDPNSIEVRYGTAEFARAVIEALPRMRFRAARVGECAVAQDALQPFDFALKR